MPEICVNLAFQLENVYDEKDLYSSDYYGRSSSLNRRMKEIMRIFNDFNDFNNQADFIRNLKNKITPATAEQ